jgi:hypothetical protein
MAMTAPKTSTRSLEEARTVKMGIAGHSRLSEPVKTKNLFGTFIVGAWTRFRSFFLFFILFLPLQFEPTLLNWKRTRILSGDRQSYANLARTFSMVSTSLDGADSLPAFEDNNYFRIRPKDIMATPFIPINIARPIDIGIRKCV